MEQFVLVLASAYNKNLITQSSTKQELPKYQPSQNTLCTKLIHLKRRLKKLVSKADSLVDKTLSCPHIKLSKSKTLNLDGVETGIFLTDFAQKLRRENADVPDSYFILLDTAGISLTLIPNQDSQAKEREIWVFFKI